MGGFQVSSIDCCEVPATFNHTGGPGLPGTFVVTNMFRHLSDSWPCTLIVDTS